jgi:hypothetical protein
LLQWFPDRKGLASGMVICGFGGAGLVFTTAVNTMLTSFARIPDYAGPPGSISPTVAAGRLTAEIGGSYVEVVLATSADVAKLSAQDLPAGYYIVGTGDTGAAAALGVIGACYTAVMLVSAFTMRRPPPDYTPPALEATTDAPQQHADEENVPLASVMKTPQFWLLSTVFAGMTTGGMGMFAVAKPMMSEVFSSQLPSIVTESFGSSYLLLMASANLVGRVAWAEISDRIGRRRTFVIFTFSSIALYAGLPTLVGSVVSSGSALPLYGFIASTVVAMSMMGGTYSIMPAYEADLFGSKYVGPIHGRFLLFGAGLAGVIGPEIILRLRAKAKKAAIDSLLLTVSGYDFERVFGAPITSAPELFDSNDLTIAKLMPIAPTGTADPSPFLYDSTMYAMAWIMAVAAISHAAIGDVNRKHLE